MKLQIIIADDHAIVRKGLKQILLDEMLDAQVSEATSTENLLEIMRQQKFDLVISDISMPGRSGIDLLKQLHIDYPSLPVLILSMHPETQYAMRALKAGAAGYLTKDTASEELVKAVHQILNGRKYISPSLAELLAENVGGNTTETSHEILSDREFEVMKMIAAGKSISEIAEALSISINTVSTYRSRVLEKMKLQTNANLTLYAVEHKLI